MFIKEKVSEIFDFFHNLEKAYHSTLYNIRENEFCSGFIFLTTHHHLSIPPDSLIEDLARSHWLHSIFTFHPFRILQFIKLMSLNALIFSLHHETSSSQSLGLLAFVKPMQLSFVSLTSWLSTITPRIFSALYLPTTNDIHNTCLTKYYPLWYWWLFFVYKIFFLSSSQFRNPPNPLLTDEKEWKGLVQKGENCFVFLFKYLCIHAMKKIVYGTALEFTNCHPPILCFGLVSNEAWFTRIGWNF